MWGTVIGAMMHSYQHPAEMDKGHRFWWHVRGWTLHSSCESELSKAVWHYSCLALWGGTVLCEVHSFSIFGIGFRSPHGYQIHRSSPSYKMVSTISSPYSWVSNPQIGGPAYTYLKTICKWTHPIETYSLFKTGSLRNKKKRLPD